MPVVDSARSPLQIGDQAPFCCGMTNEKLFYSFDAQAGRPAVLILAGCLPPSQTRSFIDRFATQLTVFAAIGADVLLLVNIQSASMFEYNDRPQDGLRTVFCVPDFFKSCGLDESEPSALIIDRSLHVLGHITVAQGDMALELTLTCLTNLPTEAAREIALPAPILLIPNIISADFCDELINHFESNPHSDGGMASIDRAGNPVHKIDHSKKKREDCIITPADSVHDRILDALARRCLPEIKKAFQFDASYTDRILVTRYDETGGYFLRHRDNVAAAVAFRQFAVSVNLNSDYDGGYLLFPEYNSHRYRPPRGSGIVFSASLLHEATAIKRGNRYVLLTFFHNKEAEALRLRIIAGEAATETRRSVGA